ncbi:division plane positioning ATPase MipZ [Sphingobium subterraneum]|uniref:Chromosome partitioning protein n=1 Tax=Sphingobium subterraneum TaxID=627688 RepID=A0A841J1W6_9SPHN|nr:division plane positioning ATPase MipZ [Sphingobium subterraneum]MBB6124933.1 chromosome partitioning protein [Sphingobium subterraneum]
MTAGPAHIIVFANEKGGTGKSTTAVHVAVALASMGRKVGLIDLDRRQKTSARYLENRADTAKRKGIDLPTARYVVLREDSAEALEEALNEIQGDLDFLIIDTPGRDDPLARTMAARAHTLVTPMNDSFVDFDLIGQVDPENFKVKRLSFYSELIFEARKARAKVDGVSIDWVVLRNRVQHQEARNKKRVGDALNELSRRVGFRVVPGLSERVIFRELFPSGLTMLDKAHLPDLAISHVAARQELREMLAGFALPTVNEAMEQSAA